jgi:hypothetical protein
MLKLEARECQMCVIGLSAECYYNLIVFEEEKTTCAGNINEILCNILVL